MDTKQAQDRVHCLSARWTFPEREGIVIDRMGHGDISSWSRGTTKAKRPDCEGAIHHEIKPVRSLKALKEFELCSNKPTPKHDPRSVVAMTVAKDESVAKAIKSLDASINEVEGRIALQNRIAKVYETAIVSKVEGPKIKRKASVRKYKPGITGLDRIAKGEIPKRPQWEIDKEENSLLNEYALTLRSIYRLIYG